MCFFANYLNVCETPRDTRIKILSAGVFFNKRLVGNSTTQNNINKYAQFIEQTTVTSYDIG